MANNIDDQIEYYNDRWSKSSNINILQYDRLMKILSSFKHAKFDNLKILDLGCGTGWLASILDYLGDVTAIDLSDKAIENAKGRSPQTNFISGNIFKANLPVSEFDVVVSQEVIEHVDDQREYIDIAAKSLKKDGLLILTTPNASNLDHWGDVDKENWDIQPIENWLTVKQLDDMVSEKLSVIEIGTFILGYGNKGIYRLINSQKIYKLFKILGLHNIYNILLEKLGFGLHIYVVARKS